MRSGNKSTGNYMVLMALAMIMFACKNNSEKSNVAVKEEITVDSPWDKADEIVKNMVVPIFPDTTFDITDYGAVADGQTDNSKAFADAIAACAENGGKVNVPAGKFLTGPIHLKSNVNLHLEEGAEILFTTDKKAYLPLVHTSYEGIELMNYSPLIYAYKQTNIAVTGKGILNGQAGNENWWPWSGKDTYGHSKDSPSQHQDHNLPALWKYSQENVPVKDRKFGEGHQIRPLFFQAFECENVLVQGVTFTNAPFWVIHPIKSTHVTVDGVTVDSHGPNNDGCNPEYSKNVHIKNCVFDTGDDCIAIKSGRDDEGRRVGISSENIVIEDCVMKDGHGGVVIGSEISGGVRNVYARNNKMSSPNLDRAIRIKTNTKRGGTIENIFVKNIEIGEVKEAVLRINTHYATYANQEGEHIPVIRNIHLEDITVENGGEYGILIQGREEMPVKNVILTNIKIKTTQIPLKIENVDSVVFNNVIINGKKIE